MSASDEVRKIVNKTGVTPSDYSPSPRAEEELRQKLAEERKYQEDADRVGEHVPDTRWMIDAIEELLASRADLRAELSSSRNATSEYAAKLFTATAETARLKEALEFYTGASAEVAWDKYERMAALGGDRGRGENV